MIYDVIIIGAGPSGISCAVEARKASMNYLLLDKGTVAHSIQQFQREMFFFSTPELLEVGGVPFVISSTRPTSEECVNYYRSVIKHFNLSILQYQNIEQVIRNNQSFNVVSADGKIYTAKNVVLAIGYYDNPSLLDVPGERLPHVSHYYRDALPYFRQKVLVVGGKNSAVEAALDLYRHGADVTVLHRGETLSQGVKYWILPDFENRVKDGSIKLLLNTVVTEFHPDKTYVCHQAGGSGEIENNFVFILIGYKPDVQFLTSAGINVDIDSLIPQHNPDTFKTNVPNLFIAGGLVGGRFNNKVFIENGREHGRKIISAIMQKS